MATLSFEAETHAELVAQVKRWLASVDGEEDLLTPAQAVVRAGELTKDALRIVASSAPAPIAQSDVVKGLTAMGYQVTDATSKAVVDALDTVSNVTGDQVVKRVQKAGATAAFVMSKAVAEQLLKAARG